MHPSIEQIRALLVLATEGITDAGWRRSRGEGKWTAMQILEHLSLSYSRTAEALQTGPGG